MEGMLSPEMKEEITGTAEIREIFKISKVGSIAGCMVTDGMVKRGSSVRVIRQNVVVHQGELESLKRFKDDASETIKGQECGIGVENFEAFMPGDIINVFHVELVKQTL